MNESGIARILMHGRSQVVHLPSEFRLPGDHVRVRCVEGGFYSRQSCRTSITGSVRWTALPKSRSWRMAVDNRRCPRRSNFSIEEG